MVYNIIDQSNGFYTCSVSNNCRSRCNIVFQIKGGDEKLEKDFLIAAQKNNILSLRGHKIAGHLRASIYIATGVAEVTKLAKFMEDFRLSSLAENVV